MEDIEQARLIRSPLAIGQLILPKLWGGEDFNFRCDPFLQVMEVNVMKAIQDRKHRRFQKYNAPPQVSKSTFLEILTSLWTLSFWPNTRIILIAYSDDIAIKSGALVRDIVQTWGAEFFGIEIDSNYDSKQEWRLAGHMGGMLSVGIGSRITGQAGDLIILGDVVKNMEEAASAGTLAKHWEEYKGSIRSRLQPGGTMLLGATRFSDQDISGQLDTKMAEPGYKGDRWESFSFKAIAEPALDEDVDVLDETWRDFLGRPAGQPLKTRFSDDDEDDPENWEHSHFYAMRETIDEFTFSCLYQQEPTSPTGGMFPKKKWAWYDDTKDLPYFTAKRRSWDLAASEGAGDWSVGSLVGKDLDNTFYILDVERFQKGPDDALEDAKMIAAGDGVVTPIQVEASRNGDGKTVVAFYAKELEHYEVKASNAEGSKEARARPYSTLMQKGRVKLPRHQVGVNDKGEAIWESPDWVPGFIDEHRKMMGDGRKGRHDDQIDTVAHAINDMLDSSAVEMLNPRVAVIRRRGSASTIVLDRDPEDDESADEPVAELQVI